MDQTIERILFVINPVSGGSNKSQLIEGLEHFITEYNLNHRMFFTTEKNNLEHLNREIKEFVPEIVVAVGGDGTCNLVANTILNSEKKLAILPFGSANGLATELKIPRNLSDSLNILISGKVKLIDTLTINGKLCLHLSDIGLNARVIKRFEKEEIRGIYGYIKHFFKELREARPFNITVISSNGNKIKKKAQVVVIANASKYGTGAIINPNGLMDDGKFELVIVKPYPFLGFLSIAAAIFTGYLDKISYVEIESHKRVTIVKNKNQPLHIDGEIIEDSEEVEVVINPASLRVMVARG